MASIRRSERRLTLLAAFALAAGLVSPAFAQDTETPATPPAAETPAAPEAAPEPAPVPSETVPPAAETPPPAEAPAVAAPPVAERPAAPAAEVETPVIREGAGEEVHASESPHYPIKKPELLSWSFAGIFGKYDAAQLQRGFQVYREVCSTCHSMKLVPFRALADETGPGFSEAQVRTLAAEAQIQDGPNEEGSMFERPGRPSDHFPSPFPNDQAAAAANSGAAPPDLSMMAKARGVSRGFPWFILDGFTTYQEGGVDYIHALLTGYDQTPPAGVTVPPGTHYNPYFASGPALAMPKPLVDGQVTYSDGSPQTVDQYSRDVSAFLMWTAEPRLVDRKRIGFQVGIFLIVFAVLMYFTKRRVWSKLH
jgi:ubiquinol-cytochrome c reductase cytochrome c1 subunit